MERLTVAGLLLNTSVKHSYCPLSPPFKKLGYTSQFRRIWVKGEAPWTLPSPVVLLEGLGYTYSTNACYPYEGQNN